MKSNAFVTLTVIAAMTVASTVASAKESKVTSSPIKGVTTTPVKTAVKPAVVKPAAKTTKTSAPKQLKSAVINKPAVKKQAKVSAITLLAEKMTALDSRLKSAEEKISTLEGQVQTTPVVPLMTEEAPGAVPVVDTMPVPETESSMTMPSESAMDAQMNSLMPEKETATMPEPVALPEVATPAAPPATPNAFAAIFQGGKPASLESVGSDHVAFKKDGKFYRCELTCPDLSRHDLENDVRFFPKKGLVEFQNGTTAAQCPVKSCSQID